MPVGAASGHGTHARWVQPVSSVLCRWHRLTGQPIGIRDPRSCDGASCIRSCPIGARWTTRSPAPRSETSGDGARTPCAVCGSRPPGMTSWSLSSRTAEIRSWHACEHPHKEWCFRRPTTSPESSARSSPRPRRNRTVTGLHAAYRPHIRPGDEWVLVRALVHARATVVGPSPQSDCASRRALRRDTRSSVLPTTTGYSPRRLPVLRHHDAAPIRIVPRERCISGPTSKLLANPRRDQSRYGGQ